MNFNKIPELNQRQDSLHDQLADLIVVANRLGIYDAVDLIVVANRLGMYDAADYIKMTINNSLRKVFKEFNETYG